MKHLSLVREGTFAVLTVLMLLGLWLLDPDPGASSTIIWIHRIGLGLVIVWVVHWVQKLLQPYIKRRELAAQAERTPVGAGLALLAHAVMWLAVSMIFVNLARAQPLPPGAVQHMPMLLIEQRAHYPSHPAPHYFAALIHHESCITDRSPRCWQPTSRLKSAREEGAGLGQITRAYRADGSLRFDALAEMRARHPSLSEWSWSNVYQRPDLQMRGVILKVRDDGQRLAVITDPVQRMAFTDAAYNGGLGGVQSDRRACGLKTGCNPQVWFGHVELTCTKSRAALYGNRSACDINRHHVHDVLRVKMPRYAPAWASLVG